MNKQSLVKGTLILGIAGIVAKLLGLFFRWPLVMMVGDEGIGYYQMAYPLLTFFIAVASGIPIAVSKLVAQRCAASDKEGAFLVLRKALIIMMIIGGGFTLILLIFNQVFMGLFNWDKKVLYSLLGVAFAPLVLGLMSAFRGFFQGFQNMTPTAVSQLLEQIGRIIIGVGLAGLLLPRGIEFAAGGATFGASIGGLIGLIYLYIKYRALKKEWNIGKLKGSPEIMGKVLRVAIPISVGAAVISSLTVIDSALVPQLLVKSGKTMQEATIIFGQLSGKAGILVHLPLTLCMALCASIVPIISELNALGKKKEMEDKIKGSISISMAIALPTCIGLFGMAGPILATLFPGMNDGARILSFYSLSIPFMVLSQVTTSILQGAGKYTMPVVNLFVGCLIKTILTIILVPNYNLGVYGAIIATIIGYLVAMILNIIYMNRTLKVRVGYGVMIFKNVIASVCMIVPTILIFNFLAKIVVSIGVRTLISISVGVIIYSILVVILGIFDISFIQKKLVKN